MISKIVKIIPFKNININNYFKLTLNLNFFEAKFGNSISKWKKYKPKSLFPTPINLL